MVQNIQHLMIHANQQRLATALRVLADKGGGDREDAAALDAAFVAIIAFENLAAVIYRMRQSLPASDPQLQAGEDTLALAAQTLLSLGTLAGEERGYQAWRRRYLGVWQENRALFATTALVFLGSGIIGWSLAAKMPEYLPVILPQANMEAVLEHHAWFQELNNSPLIGGFAIAVNNIKVSILAFVGSALFGLGGLATLVYNGLLFGAVLGFCYLNKFGGPLTEFVLGHGPLELSIIIAATFSGLLFGRVFFIVPNHGFAQRLRRGGQDAGVVLAGILPWLFVAGVIEAFISPQAAVPWLVKIGLGLTMATRFWFWTLAPGGTQRRAH